MNKTRLIWGIVCLALAALLGVLSLTLAEDQFFFMVGDRNIPWLPAVILAAAGIILLVTAGRNESEAAEMAVQPETPVNNDKVAKNKQLESMAFGLFLVMLGGFALVPDEKIPGGSWSIGVGLIFLGLNAARYYYKIRMSGFTTVLGILALVGGIAELIWKQSLEGALLLIVLGAYLILKPYFEKRQLFGKAEQS